MRKQVEHRDDTTTRVGECCFHPVVREKLLYYQCCQCGSRSSVILDTGREKVPVVMTTNTKCPGLKWHQYTDDQFHYTQFNTGHLYKEWKLEGLRYLVCGKAIVDFIVDEKSAWFLLDDGTKIMTDGEQKSTYFWVNEVPFDGEDD